MKITLAVSLLFPCLAIAAPARQALDAKLLAQWQRFDAVRALALSRPVGRDEWERTLAISPAFTPDDLRTLRDWQNALAAQAKARDERESTIRLEALRQGAPERIRQFCADFPKGGQLHVHSWGTMSEPGMADLLTRINPLIHPQQLHDELKPHPGATATLYPPELAYLQGLTKHYGKEVRYAALKPIDQAKLRDLFFLTTGSHPFPRFEAVFRLVIRLILDKPPLDVDRLLYDDYFTRAQAENVSYVEIADWEELKPEALAVFDARSRDIQSRFGIDAKWQYSFIRIESADLLTREAQKLLALTAPATLVGINLVDDETNEPAVEKAQPIYIPFLRAAQEGRTRLHRDIHAGELGDPRDVRDSLILGAERIGHGVLLREDPVTLEYARRHRIPLEANLTSNLRLGAVKSYREHPYLHFLRLGLKVSLSTDDEGIFGTDPNQECVHAIAETDINYHELKEMTLNSIETSFAPDDEKKALMEKLNARLTAFESRWKGQGLTH